MLPVATTGRTYQQSLTGTPTPLAIPTADIDLAQVVLVGTAAFTVAFNATDIGFPVPANTMFPVPIQRQGMPYVAGTGTLNVMALGFGASFAAPAK